MYILYFLICIYIIKYHTYIPYLFDNTPHKYCFLPCVYLYYCNILFVFIPILTLRDCAGFVISTLSGSLLVMNSYPPPRPLSHSTRQPEPQQQQPQPQHRLLPMGSKPRRQPSSSWHRTVRASKQKRNGLSCWRRRQPTEGRLAGQRKTATVSHFGCGDTSGAQLLVQNMHLLSYTQNI